MSAARHWTEATGPGVRFFRETLALYKSSSTTERSYYPLIRELWSRLLEQRGLPFEVRAETSERRTGSAGADLPDLALYDRGEFVAVFAEVKTPSVSIDEMAVSTDRNDQVGRYLSQTGVVLLSNVRGVGLLACKPGYQRTATAVSPDQRDLLQSVDLWPTQDALRRGKPIEQGAITALGELLERAVTEFAPIADPLSLARILARQARRAKADLPERFESVASLLEDYRKALGLSFDLETEKGAEFFRSSLIQTAYYGLFAGWPLWHRARDDTAFRWDHMDAYLRIPFLGKLFYEFTHPDRLAELRLAPHLDRATATLGRVDHFAFFSRFSYPSLSGQDGDDTRPTAALTYFYEPFLEAFDPDLRKELGSGTRRPTSSAIKSARWTKSSERTWPAPVVSPILASSSSIRAAARPPICSKSFGASLPTFAPVATSPCSGPSYSRPCRPGSSASRSSPRPS